jgi:hypothetical protein
MNKRNIGITLLIMAALIVVVTLSACGYGSGV